MNPKRKKKVYAILIAVLTLCVLYFVNAFTGNPISNMLAKRAAQQYIETTYPTMQLQIKKCAYNFKFSHYYAFVKSASSPDTMFSIYMDSFGHILRDDYEFEVANSFTTYRRLDEELREIAKNIIEGQLDYDFDHTTLAFPQEFDTAELTLDMVLDVHNPPFPLTADVTLFSEALSYAKIAEVAADLERVLSAENIPIEAYSIRLLPLSNKPENEQNAVSWADALSISDFPAKQMREENLPQVMEKFETQRVAALDLTDKRVSDNGTA